MGRQQNVNTSGQKSRVKGMQGILTRTLSFLTFPFLQLISTTGCSPEEKG